MGETEIGTTNQATDRNQLPKLINPAFAKFFFLAPQRLQNFFEVGNPLIFYIYLFSCSE